MKLSLHSTHLDIISTRKNNIIIMTHNFSFLTLFHRWWHNNQLLKGESTILNDKKVQNILHLRKLNRTDLLSSFMCHSSNNNITDPITASVMVDLNCKLNRFNTKYKTWMYQFSIFHDFDAEICYTMQSFYIFYSYIMKSQKLNRKIHFHSKCNFSFPIVMDVHFISLSCSFFFLFVWKTSLTSLHHMTFILTWKLIKLNLFSFHIFAVCSFLWCPPLSSVCHLFTDMSSMSAYDQRILSAAFNS